MPDSNGSKAVVFTNECRCFLPTDVSHFLQTISKNCISWGETIAVAESVTSGFIQSLLSTANNAQDFFQGGITVYNAAQKARHLHIEPVKALKCNGVAEDISEKLAENVCTLFCSEIGIGITGYASPVPEQGIYELHAFVAIVRQGRTIYKNRITPDSPTDAYNVQLQYAVKVIEILAAYIK